MSIYCEFVTIKSAGLIWLRVPPRPIRPWEHPALESADSRSPLMPCVPGTKRPSCPDDLGPLNPGGVGFMERGTPTCHEAGEMGIPESRTQGHVDSGLQWRRATSCTRFRAQRTARRRSAMGSAAHADKIPEFGIVDVVVHSWPRGVRGFNVSRCPGSLRARGFNVSRYPGSLRARGKAPASAPGKAGGWGRTGGYACAAAAVAGCSIASVSRMIWCDSRTTVPSSRISALPSASVFTG